MRVFASLVVIALLSFFPLSAVADTNQEISEIVVEGVSRVDESVVLIQVESKVGEKLNSAQVTEDIKEIYRTGFFQKVRAERGAGGKLIFVVTEKPAIRNVYLEGNDDVTKDVLQKKINIDTLRFLERRKIAAKVKELEEYYESQSFFGTNIQTETEDVGSNQVDLTFIIEEGSRKYIEEIRFEGNTAFDSDDLEDEISTSTHNFWTSWLTGAGTAHDLRLENDTRSLTRFYLKNGYVNVRVAEPELVEVDDDLALIFRIKEGEQHKVGTIRAIGDLVEGDEAKTVEGLELETGDIFNVDTLREDTFLVTEKYTDIGYAFTNVEPKTEIDSDRRVVDIVFYINRGDLIRVNRINVTGNKKTRDYVVRRTLKISERELFSSSKISRSQQLLQRLGYFDEVTITPEPTDRADEVDLKIQLREGQTGSFSAGAGFSSGDGFVVSTRISENNLFGSGKSITLDVNTGSLRENYLLSFNNPRVYNTQWSAGIDGLSVKREFDEFDRRQSGGSVTVGYPLWFLGPEYLEDMRFSLRYEFLKIEIDNLGDEAPQLVIDQEGGTTNSSVTPRLVRNTINNPLDPTHGSRQTLSVELAGIGGDQEFWLLRAANTFYYPLVDTDFGPIVFANRTRFGYGKTFDSEEDFPLFRRFFPGGINTVRGFDTRELGPKDEEGNEFGGNKQLVSNVELIFPVIPSAGLKGVVFYDIGEAFDDDVDIEFGDLRQAFGWGFRWRSPIAPIRIEVGYPIDREEGDKSVVTHFSFGAPR